jgi:phage terminase small subunit
MLKNPRHEIFAQLLASGKTATDAYEEAGYKPIRFNARSRP